MIAAFGSLAAVAKAAGVSETSVRKWRAGQSNPKPDVLASLRRRAAARLRAQTAQPAATAAPSIPAAVPLAGAAAAPFPARPEPERDPGEAEAEAEAEAEDDADAPPAVVADRRPSGLRSGPAAIPEPTTITVTNAPAARPKASGAGAGARKPLSFFGVLLPNTGPAAVLSERELGKIRVALGNLLRTAFKYTDQGMSATNRKHATATVWSDMDDAEIGILVEFIIQRGQVNKTAAQVARGLASLSDQTQVLMVLGPRLVQSVLFYRFNGGFGW